MGGWGGEPTGAGEWLASEGGIASVGSSRRGRQGGARPMQAPGPPQPKLGCLACVRGPAAGRGGAHPSGRPPPRAELSTPCRAAHALWGGAGQRGIDAGEARRAAGARITSGEGRGDRRQKGVHPGGQGPGSNPPVLLPGPMRPLRAARCYSITPHGALRGRAARRRPLRAQTPPGGRGGAAAGTAAVVLPPPTVGGPGGNEPKRRAFQGSRPSCRTSGTINGRSLRAARGWGR